MALLLILFILLAGSSFLAVIFSKKIEKIIPVWIFMIIAILYIFGLLNKLKYGVTFIEFISFAFTGYLLYDLIKYKKIEHYKELLFTKGLIIFITLFAILFLMHRGRYISGWDEFSHWGDVVKAMFDINDFSTSPLSMSTFKSYPPSMSLFQYFWVKVANNFNESYLYISYQLFMFSLFIPFITDIKGKLNTLLGISVMLLLPLVFYTTYYQAIYIDPAVGMLFAYIVLSIYFCEKEELFDKIKLCLSIFILVLLKNVGLFFGVVAIIIYIIKNIKFVNIKKFVELNKKYLITILIMILALLIAKLTWNYEITSNHVTASFSQKIDFKQLLNIITLRDTTYRVEVLKNFINALFEKEIFDGVVKVSFIKALLLFCIGYYYIINKSSEKAMTKKIIVGLFISWIVYIFGIFVMYCFKFSSYEALNLASYERYMNIYAIALLATLFFEMYNKKNMKVLMIIVCSLFLLLSNNAINNIHKAKISSISNRLKYTSFVEKVNQKIGNNSKIYVIVQNSSGFEFWNLRYLFRPNEINIGEWSIGTKYNENDVWTINYTATTFIEKYKEEKYNYLYLYKIDDSFVKQFETIFFNNKIDEKGLYYLDENLGKLKLIQ